MFKPAFGGAFYQLPASEGTDGIPQDGCGVEYDEIKTFTQFNPQDLSMSLRFTLQSKSIVSTYFTIHCKGIPVNIELSHTKIDFGCVYCGTAVSKSIYIKNNSKYDCPYEFEAEGLMPVNGSSVTGIVDTQIIQCVELPEITRPKNRILGQFPLKITPASGVAPSLINTSISIGINLIDYTSTSNDLIINQKEDRKSYIPPQPISFYVALKTPGSPV